MHKILGTLLVGAAVVGGVTLAKGASTAASPEAKVCERLADLCSADPPKQTELDECVHDMKDLRKQAGSTSFEKTRSCIDESQSCAAASGCIVGGAGVGMVGEMLKGLGNAMTK